MVSRWGIDSHFNIEQNQIGDIEIMISVYSFSGSFGSRVKSKSIGYNTYTVRRIDFSSKPSPIHGPFKNSNLNYSYSRIQFSRLPKAVAKSLIYPLSHKASNASKGIDPVINGFSPNYESSHLHICDQSIVTFGIR